MVRSQIKIIRYSNREIWRFCTNKTEKIIGLDISAGMLELEKKIAQKTFKTIEMVLQIQKTCLLKTIILMRSRHLVYGILKHWKRTSGNFFKTKWGICNSRNFCP
jgi:hypothetical protein